MTDLSIITVLSLVVTVVVAPEKTGTSAMTQNSKTAAVAFCPRTMALWLPLISDL